MKYLVRILELKIPLIIDIVIVCEDDILYLIFVLNVRSYYITNKHIQKSLYLAVEQESNRVQK